MADEAEHVQGQRTRVFPTILPALLFMLVLGYELVKHLLIRHEGVGLEMVVDIFLFGIVGPAAVALSLRELRRYLIGQAASAAELRQAAAEMARTQAELIQLNHELETIVARRTEHLLQARLALEEKNEALRQANEELRELDRLKSDFVSLVSHELRSPLTSIKGGVELVLRFGGSLDPAHRDALEIIATETARLSRLVEDILNVSRLEAGKLRVSPGLLSLPPFLEGIVRCKAAGAPGHWLQLQVEPGLPLAWADENLVNDVLFNLLDNAVKYSPSGGHISVKAARLDDGYVRISVTDEGPGIPPEDRARIFDKFYRGEGAENQVVDGHGLGLYVAQKLVAAQGGQIWVENQPDRGACFSFTLPVAVETADEVESAGD